MKKSTSDSRKLKSKNPNIQFVDLGLCRDQTCNKYTEYEQKHGIAQMHRHAWVLHRNVSPNEVIAESENFFGGSCIDITNSSNPVL